MDLLYRPVIAVFTTILVLVVSSLSLVHGQEFAENPGLSSELVEDKVERLDNIMSSQIAVTLTGLSLTGASFLVSVTKNLNQESDVYRINTARRSFIKAFFMFLLCTITILLFDFLQILNVKHIVIESFLDIIITYTLFGIGVYYLTSAAKALYVVYGKTKL